MRRWVVFMGFCLAMCCAKPAYPWGATGHVYLSGIAIEALPVTADGVPEFVRTKDAVQLIAALSVEPDRSRGAGKIHDEERDPGHYIDLDDDGTIFGLTPLSHLARTREDFDTALRARGVTQYKVGYLPYTIADGWQQIVKDFGYWRALTAVINAPDTSEMTKAWATADRRYREMLTLRDIGIWSHYVGDASQPMHVSIHFDGWGAFANPTGATQEAGTHGRFEGLFVRRTVDRAAIAGKVAPYRPCKCAAELRISNYLSGTRAFVAPFYELEKAGAFAIPPAPSDGVAAVAPDSSQAKGVAFAIQRLAAGASEMRDMIIDAWTASLSAQVGYPAVAVKAILAKPSLLVPETFASD